MIGDALADRVAFMKTPEAYPDTPTTVEALETHMSWVFLTEKYAYKLKKPVRYAFLDFSTPAARRRDCEQEIVLNRRLADQVYLGVSALTRQDGALHLDGRGEAIDWLVVMHRLPASQMLDDALRRRVVNAAAIRSVAGVLVEFYGNANPIGIEGYASRLRRDIERNARELFAFRDAVSHGVVQFVTERQLSFLDHARDRLQARVSEGRIVEGHGDLRPEHICLVTPPQIIDCLEFNRDFRLLDAADELAFLSMECERLGAPFVGPLLFGEYERTTGDRAPGSIIHFYESFRACLRARLALWHLREPAPRTPEKWPIRANEYLSLAHTHARKLV